MTVRQRGRSWQADITVNGQRVRETFTSREDAEAWELEARASIIRGKPLPSANRPTRGKGPIKRPSGSLGGTSIGALMERTFDRFWATGPSAAKMKVNMGQVSEYFGADTPIERIDTDAIDGFIGHLIARGNSNGTINRKLAVLSKTLRFARDRGIINSIPRLERKPEGFGRIRWLSADEEEALLRLLRGWGKEDHAEVVEVLIDTGFRPVELYNLTARDVSVKEGSITIWKSKGRDIPRTVYMTKRVRAIIERRISAATAPTDQLFPYDNFWMRYVWDRARTSLGLANDEHFVPYICRHTCASRLVQRGIPINVVREWMGHKSIVMTMRYAHLAPANLKAAAGALEEAA